MTSPSGWMATGSFFAEVDALAARVGDGLLEGNVVVDRRCAKCGMTKPLEDFPRNRRYPLGRAYRCRGCEKKRFKEYWDARAEPQRQRRSSARSVLFKTCSRCGETKPRSEFHRDNRYSTGRLYSWCKTCHADRLRPSRAKRRAQTDRNVDYDLVVAIWGRCCHICGTEIPEGPRQLHIDHVVPLARGGEHSYRNLRPAHAVCNMRKHTRPLEEVMPRGNRYVLRGS